MQIRSPQKFHFTAKGNTRIAVDSLYYYQFSTIDSSGKKYSFFIKNLPVWLMYNEEQHSISGRASRPGQYMIHILASTIDTTIHQRFMLTVYDKETANILTLGNSITNGTAKYNSYRRALWRLLHQSNYNIDFIGSWDRHHMGGTVPAPDFDMDHEGHSGWKAADVLNQPEWDKQRANIHEWIKTYTPGIVLMELGTNEVFQCVAAKDAMHNIAEIIDILRAANPRVKIFLAQIPPLGAQWIDKKLCNNQTSYGQALRQFNRELLLLGTALTTAVSPVIMVDQYHALNPAIDMYDDIHPNESGEKKMAEKWYKAIKKYLVKLRN